MVCAMGSSKMCDCIQRVRQISVRTAGREGIAAWLEGHTAALMFTFPVPGFPGPAVFGGEAVRGLELGAVLNCPSWPKVASFCRCGPCWGGTLSCPDGCRPRAALCSWLWSWHQATVQSQVSQQTPLYAPCPLSLVHSLLQNLGFT